MRNWNSRGYVRARTTAPGLVLALFAALPFACHGSQTEAPTSTAKSPATAPSLGTAASFRVLGGSTVTNTGATTVHGDLGVAPGSAITGFPPGLVLGGAVHAGDATALLAQNGVTAAYVVLAGTACDFDLTGQDLGGLTLVSGVYCFASEAQLTGTLVLDAQGDPEAVFIFQIGSKLTTASNAAVSIVNGGQDCGVFWQIGSSATVGTDTAFAGSMLALTSITLATGATVSGRALARNGAVTMDSNQLFPGTCATTGNDAGTGGGAGSGGIDSGSGGTGGIGSVDAGAGGSAGSGGIESGSGGSAGADAGASCCGILCGASCTNPTSDSANCGACGNACAPDQECANGSCNLCSAFCGGECVDLDWHPFNCGACGNVCPLSQVCEWGACVPCTTLCEGICTYIGSTANCGACGNVCLVSESCENGACVPCATLCAGECADLDTDVLNCGACGNACSPGETCTSGSCLCQ